MGFYRTDKIDGRWWFIDPAGRRSICKAVCHVSFKADRILNTDKVPYAENCLKKHGSEERWREATVRQLRELGFNTLGAWSDAALAEIEVQGSRLSITPILDTASSFVAEMNKGSNAWLHGIFPDVFDTHFAEFALSSMKKKCALHADTQNILGWFADNELRWGPDWRGPEELLTLFLAMPEDGHGRKAAVNLLKSRYPSIADFNSVWKTSFTGWGSLEDSGKIVQPYGREAMYMQNQEVERKANEADPKRAAFIADCEAFAGLVAENYFSAVSAAIKKAAPNHLNLGARFAYVPQEQVIAAAARHLDVISFNCYAQEPLSSLARYATHGKPCMITEYSYRGMDTGLPNSKGAGVCVPNQVERAKAFEKFTVSALENPSLIGYHWFEYADEPKEGRHPDGENSNYGIVTIEDKPYPDLMDAMRRVNSAAEKIHQDGCREI
ncbi:MAG TPA: agarase [Lentisphaeria bacterium]|nr:MAG: hypothetical protein A2X45_16340 [Lentisphaerae bacterium GWF2_50_93]HCE45918.1 agarase [Lentisphaeria bacterium]